MKLTADFHLHSCLSPCGGLDMAPAAVARAARAAGLQAVALTDHNCARHAPVFAEACRHEGLYALHGLEVNTAEEIHVLCLFDDLETAQALGEEVYARLPDVPNRPEKMGDQVVVDREERILEEVGKHLGLSIDWPLTELGERVHALGGLWIPAHVDRPVFSLWSQLGAVPELSCDALEVTPRYRRIPLPPETWRRYPLIASSDAHDVPAVGRHAVELECRRFTLAELRRALPRARLLFHRRGRGG